MLPKLRVLLAEDMPYLQNQTCELLASLGIAPALAVDGAEAVQLACSHEFDLILMDLQMPVLDGMGATTQIRRYEQHHLRPAVPILAYTSTPLGHTEPFLRKYGMDGSLDKPATLKTIYESIVRWCPTPP
jgi:CheY-like chemotaxis protein